MNIDANVRAYLDGVTTADGRTPNARTSEAELLVLGNSLPHLHAQSVPRYLDDPDPGRPPRFMLEDNEWPLIDEDDYGSQVRALRMLLGA